MNMDVDGGDETIQALEALPEAFTAVQQTPLAFKLHYRAIGLIEATAMDDQIQAARTHLTNHLAAGDG